METKRCPTCKTRFVVPPGVTPTCSKCETTVKQDVPTDAVPAPATDAPKSVPVTRTGPPKRVPSRKSKTPSVS